MCDHIITVTFNANIPIINLYTSVFVGITYGSKKWGESAETDWIDRLKRRIKWSGIIELKRKLNKYIKRETI